MFNDPFLTVAKEHYGKFNSQYLKLNWFSYVELQHVAINNLMLTV